MVKSISSFELNPLQADLLLDVLGVKQSSANSWWVMETSTQSVENCLGFNLSTESLIIDDNRWEKTWTKFRPIFDVIINHSIISGVQFPVFLWCIKTISNALHVLIPISINSFHGISWAIFVHDSVTFAMDNVDVFPPCWFQILVLRISVSPFIKAHLS